MTTDITHVAVLTPPGRGAVAVVAVAGAQANEQVDRYFRPHRGLPLGARPLGSIVYGRWGEEPAEDVVACRRTASQLEVHCHGGAVAAARLVADFVVAGAHEQSWEAWIADREDSAIRAAARVALAKAATERTAAILLDQYHGALTRDLQGIVAQVDRDELSAAKAALTLLCQRAALGLHLTRPWKVVIAGPPNVGKSSLINALVGYERAIVFDQPGTTRDVVSAAAALDGWPIELSDTAGLRATADPLEAEGVRRAQAQAAAADLLLLLFDATQPWDAACEQLVRQWPQALVVWNKCDLLASPSQADELGASTFQVSALTRQGLEELSAGLVHRLVPEPPQTGSAVPFTPEQIAQVNGALAELELGNIDQSRELLLALLA